MELSGPQLIIGMAVRGQFRITTRQVDSLDTSHGDLWAAVDAAAERLTLRPRILRLPSPLLCTAATGVVESVGPGKWRISITSGRLALHEVRSPIKVEVDKTLNAGIHWICLRLLQPTGQSFSRNAPRPVAQPDQPSTVS